MAPPRDWLVYLLRCADGTFYCGSTNDLARRVDQHNRGRGARYCRGRGPVEVVASRDGLTRSEAGRLERRVQRTPRERKLAVLLEAAVHLG